MTVESLSWQEKLIFVAKSYQNVVFSTSFSIEDQIILDFIARNNLAVEIFTLDTGRLPKETYQVWQNSLEKYGLKIKAFYPNQDEIADFVDSLYSSIITAGTYKASSIQVAEAAKVIENTQRDLNIAIINEFAKIFNRLDIDTEEVLKAAGTKWNFLPFKPGLVGGHCISVDPYYLTHKAKEVGYSPEVILAGRRINDGMGQYVATQMVKKLSSEKIHIDESRVLIMGFTFKGDCPDVRNTKVIEIIKELKDFNVQVDVFDNWADPQEVKHEYGIKLINELEEGVYDGIILAVDHDETKKMGIDVIRKLGKEKHVVYDVKYVFEPGVSDIRL